MATRPFLAIDVGNTRVKLGVWDGSAWTRVARVDTRKPTSEEWVAFLERELQDLPVESAGVSSVVPEVTTMLRAAIERVLGKPPGIVDGTMPIPPRLAPFHTEYATPETLGADRLAVAAAAYAHYGGPAGRGAIAIDAGTAITIDAVTSAGAHLGGAILPGPMALIAGLARGTAQLPAVPFEQPASAVGGTTVESIQSGVTNFAIGGIRELLARVTSEIAPAGAPPVLVATGGWAQWFSHHVPFDVIAPELVLDGVRLLVIEQ